MVCANAKSSRNRSMIGTLPKPLLPKEHGTWGMLLVPFLIVILPNNRLERR